MFVVFCLCDCRNHGHASTNLLGSGRLRDVLKQLNGVRLEILEDEGGLPSPLLNLAAEHGHAEYVRVLLEDADVDVDSLGIFLAVVVRVL